ncbi:MAG TPA: 3-phosphoshikimate 1-carboxyvinyltransferase, partial [Nitrospinaceae bacterium]|nr:3-phosphoshikimate 1-carboxyvinyltransferase [Nitrospinaceae bacterium]
MIEIKPVQNLQTVITIPGSKSYTNRALLIAGLTDGECRLEKPLVSDDTKYMIRALKAFGVSVQEEKEAFIVSGKSGKLSVPNEDIFIGNAGTAMRFLTTLSTLAPGKIRLDGDERMRERPLADLLDCLTQMRIKAVSANNNGCPPIDIIGG